MENVRKILTPSAIWKNFNGDLPLKESKVNEMTYDGITYIEVYFSGRETESGRVRIYGLYARPQPLPMNRKLGAVLILPDCNETVDLETVNHFARMGYAVLMVDYRGDVGDTTNHTNYPSEIEYANYGKEPDIFKVERTAQETCWYEWVAVGKYALAYLKSRPEVDKIGVVGIKQGGNVGWQLLYNEDRVSCFVTLFGIGWQAYKGVHKSNSGDIEMNDERYRWLGGVDAHVYAQYASCPVLYVAGTNSYDYDCERGVDTLARVNKSIKCSFCYAPRLRNVVNKKCGDDIAVFLKKHLSRAGALSDKLYFPESPQVSIALGDDKRSAFAEVTVDCEDKLKGLCVYLSE
ncbi:MAG: dienelactone hydrolase family protein, partial [Clostridia bacterium]|nr:dienelactone hydrolase family protein [Clostridia bacterium]